MGSQLGGAHPLTAGMEGEYSLNKDAANRVEDEARYNAHLRKEEAVKLRKVQQATFAASGVELEGSAARVIEDDEVEANIEAMNMIYAGQFKKTQMRNQARLARFNGYVSLAKDGAVMALSGGAGGGGGEGAATTGGKSSARNYQANTSSTRMA